LSLSGRFIVTLATPSATASVTVGSCCPIFSSELRRTSVAQPR
jgi:hypothetical protein